MSATTTVLVLTGVAVFALAMVSLANSLQTRARLIHRRSHQLRRRIRALEEITAALPPLVESLAIPKFVNDETLTLIRAALQLDAEDAGLQESLAHAEELAEDLADESRPRPTDRVQSSDAAIARQKYYLSEAAGVMRHQHLRGRIDATELEMFLTEITWAHLMVEVVSLVAQGHRAVRRQDAMTAFAFYRKAQQRLMESHHKDTRRHRLIRQLGEIMAGERTALDTALMPETQFNPAPAGAAASAAS